MKTTLLPALRMLLALTVLCGAVYPLAVTGLARLCFAGRAGGSLLYLHGRLIGSRLLAQSFTNAMYFQPRPSAANHATVPSGASNQGPTSAALKKAIEDRAADWESTVASVPPELLLASGSGLDPHISPEAALFQLDRVARARGFDDRQRETCRVLIEQHVETPQFGFLGESRVNVLLLNCALNEYAPIRHER
jgi:potassium-transporting ATPase KdpC subunit